MSTADRKTEILDQVRTTHSAFEGALSQITPNRMTEPGVNGEWTVKDVLVHITWWEQHLLRRLRTGQDDLYTPGVDPREATREANAVTFTANRERPLDDVRAEFDASYRELVAALEGLLPEVAALDKIYEDIRADTFDHYPEHTQMLRTWLKSLDSSEVPNAPTAGRAIAPPDYGFPREATGFLPWSFALELLEQTRIYWLATTYPDGRPHLAPLWGAWIEGVFYFDGGSSTRWARNIAVNPAVAMHLERGQAVVIVDGHADYGQVEAGLGAKIVQAWDAKYGRLHPKPVDEGIFHLRPRTARGWSTEDLTDGTRWRFDHA